MLHTSKLVFVLSVLSLSIGTLVPLSGRSASRPLPRSTPEAQGVSSAKLTAFIDALDRDVDAMHSVMVLRRAVRQDIRHAAARVVARSAQPRVS